MTVAVSDFLKILDLEQLEVNLFRGISPEIGWQRVFGGLVIAQSLMAATRTVDEDRPAHSLHGYFLRPGDPSVPIIYEVDRIRDGRSFTTRRVVAIQHGQAIFSMAASFQVVEEGLTHQVEMPDVPMPEELPSEAELKAQFIDKVPEGVRRYWERKRPIEMRPTDLTHYFSRKPRPPVQNVWFRATSPLPADPSIHACGLAYASDMTLLNTSMVAHGKSLFDRDIQAASLDHALWIHHPVAVDDWLLYAQDSPASSGSRGFTRGLIFNRHGRLLASVTQEGLIRLRREDS
ncbi:MAG: acyl-CoA thioesterase II [Rhodobiaceae bacterium]|nr:acyl-CoA thioesterase II [Rhodobiaceae bacterium]